MNTTNIKKEILSYLFITIGLVVGTLGWAGFIIPSEVVGGGVTGIATALHFVTEMDIGVMALSMNVILIILAMRIIGASFGIKSIYAIAVFSTLLSFISYYVKEPLVSDRFMATVTGAILAGTGSGIVFLNGEIGRAHV